MDIVAIQSGEHKLRNLQNERYYNFFGLVYPLMKCADLMAWCCGDEHRDRQQQLG